MGCKCIEVDADAEADTDDWFVGMDWNEMNLIKEGFLNGVFGEAEMERVLGGKRERGIWYVNNRKGEDMASKNLSKTESFRAARDDQ